MGPYGFCKNHFKVLNQKKIAANPFIETSAWRIEKYSSFYKTLQLHAAVLQTPVSSAFRCTGSFAMFAVVCNF